MINPTFWKGKRVFLTGHTGFKGSWLSLWLLDLGAEVHGISLTPITEPSLFAAAKISEKMMSTMGDIRDFNALQKAIAEANPEIVIHMAAQPLVRKSYRDPLETYSTNVMGTVNILEAARSCPELKVLLNITTDKVYENKELNIPFKEADRLGGLDPYSNSKACSELVTASYRSSFYKQTKVKVVCGRAGNVIGGGDWSEDRLIPDIIRAYTNDKKVLIRSPKAIRPWQHVLESLAGYLQLIEHLYSDSSEYLENWNFGPGTDDFMTVGDIISFIQSDMKHMGLEFEIQTSDLHETQILKLDNSQAKKFLAWSSCWKAETAIHKTLEWYEKFIAGANAHDLTIQQIREFQK